MKSTDKLLNNTTNRLNITSRQISAFESYAQLSNIIIHPGITIPIPIKQATITQQKAELLAQQQRLESEIEQAQSQLNLMMDLMASIAKIEKGQCSSTKKWLRRHPKDILDKFRCPHSHCQKVYSAETSLNRHLKLKHAVVKTEPPQPYKDLHPEVNLIEVNSTYSQEESESMQIKISTNEKLESQEES